MEWLSHEYVKRCKIGDIGVAWGWHKVDLRGIEVSHDR